MAKKKAAAKDVDQEAAHEKLCDAAEYAVNLVGEDPTVPVATRLTSLWDLKDQIDVMINKMRREVFEKD